MRNRCYVLDQVDFQTCCLQGADSRFTACARTFNHNFNGFQTVLHGSFSSCFGSKLSSEWSRFTGTSETETAGACPGDRVSVRIRNRDDRIVKRGTNVCHAGFDIFTVATFRTYDFFRFSHCQLSPFLTSSCSLQYDEDLYEYEHSSSCVVRVPAIHDDDGYRGKSRFRSDV
ncbi:hypothetical protein SABR111722_21715 [Saccharibacillus brassicae]